jgi:hypothetical protein
MRLRNSVESYVVVRKEIYPGDARIERKTGADVSGNNIGASAAGRSNNNEIEIAVAEKNVYRRASH